MDPKLLAESGILLVDKPPEWTSHDVVNCVRRRFRIKKVGHCGTLDPNATGLLVILLGRGTRLSSSLTGQDKEYEGTIRLGVETSTQDLEGEVIATADPSSVTLEAVRTTAERYVGEIEQIPPMVSAVKKNGKPLYKLARKGIEVEREPRTIRIDEFRVLGLEGPDIHFRLKCSKGTYVRTLAADLGRDLGCGAYLHSLRRTRSGRFSVEDSYTMDEVKSWEKDDLVEHKIGLEKALTYL